MPKEYFIANDTKKLYSSGELASEIDRTAQTMRLWERRGILPKAPHIVGEMAFSKQGKRLYTYHHKMALKKLVEKYKIKTGLKFPEEFLVEVRKAFNDIADYKTPQILKESN